MNRVTITLTIDLPDGVVPDVAYGTAPHPITTQIEKALAEEPPHVAEFPPFAEAPKYDPDQRVAANVQKDAPAPLCQLHGPMKRYPAGVSKSSGKPFNASWRCTVDKCPTKPLWDRDAA